MSLRRTPKEGGLGAVTRMKSTRISDQSVTVQTKLYVGTVVFASQKKKICLSKKIFTPTEIYVYVVPTARQEGPTANW
jgi:hypothetical protein